MKNKLFYSFGLVYLIFIIQHELVLSSFKCYHNECWCLGHDIRDKIDDTCECQHAGIGLVKECDTENLYQNGKNHMFCSEVTLNKKTGQVNKRGCGSRPTVTQTNIDKSTNCVPLNKHEQLWKAKIDVSKEYPDGEYCRCWEELCNKKYDNKVKKVNPDIDYIGLMYQYFYTPKSK